MKRPEQAIHQAVVAHLRARPESGVFFWHTPNEGKRGFVNAAHLKAMGMIAGVPDLLILKDGRLYAIEFKAPGGRLTPSQRLVIDRMRECGATAIAAFSIDEALVTLEYWGILKRDVASASPEAKDGAEAA
ncbi:VRR-NUC domain-containing protein [Bradyrhizobium sp. SZCCHNRI1073]|uniref:VRR-NUC domain-containing protein n=1 Tax=Bradyrhizobium sp. SZCCHNRI1073 TaxID=3057280 RepID=UPI0029164011|nr:VRR-NUC domain-containing protein [Bradyrhizobium sp. SZCCHNRI1073]